TPDVVPGLTFSCAFAPSVWDIYRDDLADLGILTYDSCMNGQFKKESGAPYTTGDVLMFPIYAIEKKSLLWGAVNYTSRVVIIGFAPFQIQDFVHYPGLFVGQEPGRDIGIDFLDPKATHKLTCPFGLGFSLLGVHF